MKSYEILKPYDALLADIARDWTSSTPPRTPLNKTKRSSKEEQPGDESDEWFGLKYALELSRASQLGINQDNSSGEFSKVSTVNAHYRMT